MLVVVEFVLLSPLFVGVPPCRLVFALMGFFCFFNLYALRVNLSVALVSMVNITYMTEQEAEYARLINATVRTDNVVCEVENTTTTTAQPVSSHHHCHHHHHQQQQYHQEQQHISNTNNITNDLIIQRRH